MADFEHVYDELVRERGLSTSTDLALARIVARIMTEDPTDPARQAESVTRLVTLLPVKVEPSRKYDLAALSDAELRELERLAAKTSGEAPPAARGEDGEPLDCEALWQKVDRLQVECSQLRTMNEGQQAAIEAGGAECRRLRGEVELWAAAARVPAPADGGAATADAPAPTPAAPGRAVGLPGAHAAGTAAPPAENVVLLESREERIARLRREAGESVVARGRCKGLGKRVTKGRKTPQ